MIVNYTQPEDILTASQTADYVVQLRDELVGASLERQQAIRQDMFDLMKPERLEVNRQYRERMRIPAGTCEPRRVANGSGHGIRIPKVARKVTFAETQDLIRKRLRKEGKL